MPLTGDRTHNPGTCLDWELNHRPFTLWVNTQPLSTICHTAEHFFFLFNFFLSSPEDFLKKDFIYLFLERWEGREKERERNIYWFPFVSTPTGDRTHNLRMCPDQESNLWPFGLWDEAQPTEPHEHIFNSYFAVFAKFNIWLQLESFPINYLFPLVGFYCTGLYIFV